MDASGARKPQPYERRTRPRVKVGVPVRFCHEAAGHVAESSSPEGETVDLSAAGAFFTTWDAGPFESGETLSVVIAIPPELRRLVPFSRMGGSCRIVRASELEAPSGGRQWGLGIEFASAQMTMLGSIVI